MTLAIGNSITLAGSLIIDVREVTPPVTYPSPNSFFKFEENFLPDPSSVATNQIVDTNSVLFDNADGADGYYANFSGDQGGHTYVDYDSNGPSGEVTCIMWLNPRSVGMPATQFAYFQNKDTTNVGRYVTITSNGLSKAVTRDNDGTAVTADIPVNVDEWNFVVYRQSLTELSYQVNDVVSTVPSTSMLAWLHDVYLGVRHRPSVHSDDGHYNGGMDNIMIFNESLSQEQIDKIRVDHYTKAPAPILNVPAGFIHHFTLDTINGTTIPNEVDGAADGFLYGGTQTTGRFGQALLTTGSSAQGWAAPIFAHTESPETDPSFAISMWVDSDYSVPVGDYVPFIFHRGADSTHRVQLNSYSGDLVGVKIGSTNFNSVTSLVPGLHHLLVQYDSATRQAELWMDGLLEGSATVETGFVRPEAGIETRIGKVPTSYPTSQDNSINGFIDQVYVYDRFLTNDEVLELYEEPAS